MRCVNLQGTNYGVKKKKKCFFCILFFTDSRKSLHEGINEAKTTDRTIPPSNPLSRILWLSVHVLPPYGMKYA